MSVISSSCWHQLYNKSGNLSSKIPNYFLLLWTVYGCSQKLFMICLVPQIKHSITSNISWQPSQEPQFVFIFYLKKDGDAYESLCPFHWFTGINLIRYKGGTHLTEHKINKKYKDRLFRLIFQDKKDLLELYNAINNSDYTNREDWTGKTEVVYKYGKMKLLGQQIYEGIRLKSLSDKFSKEYFDWSSHYTVLKSMSQIKTSKKFLIFLILCDNRHK